jgi:cytochrome c-type biogenesis protein CcmH
MMVFSILAGLLLLMAAAFVLTPIFYRRTPAPAGSGSASVHVPDAPAMSAGQSDLLRARAAVLRSQLKDLDSDLENGTLSREQYDLARLDLQRSFLEGSAEAEPAAAPHPTTTTATATTAPTTTAPTITDPANAGTRRRRHAVAAVLVVLILPLVALPTYWLEGTGPMGWQTAAPAAPTPASAGNRIPGMGIDIEQAVRSLSERLEAQPEDPEGWAMLGRSLVVLDQPRAAAGAYAQAIRYGGGSNPELLITYANLLGSLDGTLNQRAKSIIERALALAPENPNALWLAGMAAFQAEEYAATKAFWAQLERLLPPGSEEAQLMRSNLVEVEMRLLASDSTRPAPDADASGQPPTE